MRGLIAVLLVVVGAMLAVPAGAAFAASPESPTASAAALESPALLSPLTEPLTGGRHGGVLNVLQETDFESLDPGIAYYSLDYEVVFATQRPLYSNLPNSIEPTPDMAAGPAQISPDGKTVTVMIRPGVHFSPPVNREVTSADVAYAIERGMNPHVANPYIGTYFGSVLGLRSSKGGPVPGISTPNSHEIVFELERPLAGLLVQALQLPLTAPVPRGYAKRFDAHAPSNYWAHEVATGPYMLKNTRAGKVLGVGYRPGSSATLVRNPNWRRAQDIRPAYLNAIQIRVGGDNEINSRAALEGANVLVNEPPAQRTVRLADEHHPGQLEISAGAGDHYIALNNHAGPFANVNLRKALWAAMNRTLLDKVRGGPLVTDVASHFLYPTIPGFEQSGGMTGPTGPQFDFDEHPEGDMAVAEKYIRLAGYPSGRYTGTETVSVVGALGEPAEADAELVNDTLLKLGFVTEFNLVPVSIMYSRYCNVPSQEIDVCPNVGWIADFADPQAVLDTTFNGQFILPHENVNWGQTNVASINSAMTAAEEVVGPTARGEAWAKIDEQLVEDATDIPFDWDKQANVEGRRVAGVGDVWNVGAWDYSWTSLK